MRFMSSGMLDRALLTDCSRRIDEKQTTVDRPARNSGYKSTRHIAHCQEIHAHAKPASETRRSRPTSIISSGASSPISSAPRPGRAVFYPRVLCPFTGSDKLEWRVSKGLGTVYATTVVHPGGGQALQRGADRLRRGLPPDEPGRGHRARAGADRPARALPRAPARRRGRRPIRCSRRRRARDGRA